MIQLCGCVSFLVMAWNSSQNETYWVTFLWSASQCLVFIRPNTLLLCISLFCIFLLYRTDLQVEVQIRILLKDKYEILSKMQTPAITLWFPGKCQSCFFIIEKQQINLYIKWFQHSICISLIRTKTNTEISFSFWLTLFYSISLS